MLYYVSCTPSLELLQLKYFMVLRAYESVPLKFFFIVTELVDKLFFFMNRLTNSTSVSEAKIICYDVSDINFTIGIVAFK
jgi:hypothetical protein